ncbi:MAG: hypothetical protein FJX44_03620 [Alphaproteobacteria bacterium]|nr:hypothetical protein [Alphaproteobacteria bacterium]
MHRLEVLAAFAPRFRDKKASFGVWVPITGDGTSQHPYTFPWFDFSDLGDAFLNAAYDGGWVLNDFDWATWGHGPEGQKLVKDPKALSKASADQLAKLVTALVRQDRFVEGALASAFDSGLLLAIVERAEVLWHEQTE